MFQEVLVRRTNALIAASAWQGFCWTSIQYNHNTIAHPHIDQNNQGLSWICVCGKYTGGRLHVPSRGFATADGEPAAAVYIDGREQHWSDPFKGERYSIVAFVHSSAKSLSPAQRGMLQSLGFRCPPADSGSTPRGGEQDDREKSRNSSAKRVHCSRFYSLQ